MACSAVQVLCSGSSLSMECLLCSGGVQSLCALLYSPYEKAVRQCLNALHALTVDLNVCREVCALGAVPLIIFLIRNASGSGKGSESSSGSTLVAAAAGTLQNIGREKSSAGVLSGSGAVDGVAPLLMSSDPAVQAAAVGVLLNMHDGTPESRRALKAVLEAAIVSEALSSVFSV